MTDRELLELAAKAAIIPIKFPSTHGVKDLDLPPRRTDTWNNWNPLTDDGDALRLALHCGMRVSLRQADADGGAIREISDELDEIEATRRAIVRVAAEIGKGMQ